MTKISQTVPLTPLEELEFKDSRAAMELRWAVQEEERALKAFSDASRALLEARDHLAVARANKAVTWSHLFAARPTF